MNYRAFGKTGYEVSTLGLGCMRLPRIVAADGTASVDLEKAFELIRYAADNGVNYFDTAYSYHNMESETILGEALADGGRRAKVKIATKQPTYAFKTRGDIRRNLENTLKKLRTDYIDVYLMHNIQDNTWDYFKQMGAIEEYEKFRSEGLIKSIGFSYHGGYDAFERVMNDYTWEVCQVQQNMIDVDHEVTARSIELAGQKGTALVIMEPLRGGGLASAPESVRKIYATGDVQRAPHEWAFRHLINYPQISCILSGMTTLEQLKDNIKIFSAPDAVPNCLTEKDKDILARAKAAYEAIVTVPCTACEYCMPCPSNVDIPGIFARYNEGSMFGDFGQPQRSYMFTTRGGRDASQCAECGVCLEKCPQHIDIIGQLKLAHEQLKGWVE